MGRLGRFQVIPRSGDAADVVVRTLQQFAPNREIVPFARLIEDLGLVSDDLTEAALMLEESFGIQPTPDEYSGVRTVGDLIALFGRARSDSDRR